MADNVPKSAAKAAIIKKKWVQIIAPALFSNQIIGESYVVDAESLVGRCVSVSLMTLTGDPQKQNTGVSFKITGVDHGNVVSEMTGYKLSVSAVKKLMRRSKSKIDDSFIIETADKKVIRIKTVLVTRSRTTKSIMALLFKLERAYIAKMVSQVSFDDLIRDVVGRKLQHGLAQMLKRLQPLGACDIRQIQIIPAEKVKELGLSVMLPPEKLPELPKKQKVEEEAKEKKPEQIESQADEVQESEVKSDAESSE